MVKNEIRSITIGKHTYIATHRKLEGQNNSYNAIIWSNGHIARSFTYQTRNLMLNVMARVIKEGTETFDVKLLTK